MHLHAISASLNGPPPTPICAPPTEMPYYDPSQNWIENFFAWLNNPNCENILPGAKSNEELMTLTINVLKKHNIYGITSGPFIQDYIDNGGSRIIPALAFNFWDKELTPEKVKEILSANKFKVFAEVTIQYNGISPSDMIFVRMCQ